ncbi:MAG: ABC transporter substrate-binding protein [Proteobacteria bacterium]|nr:ABC transporter substrate-binding protein [Pseudomonadota bacterium]MBU1571150.1 ABC transporter substrate-binding protein [Pseudomonadota bacterium]
MKNNARIIILSLIIILLCLLTGCGKKQEEMTKVSYRLKWLFNASVAGDIYAGAHGFFEKEGLEVEVKEGGPERDAIKELEMGHAQFGVASADQVIRAVSKGSPVVVLAQLFQANPLQWIYRPDENKIDRPEDMKGKVVGITFGGNDETIMKALLAKYGIKENEVNLFSVRYDYTPFYERKVVLWPVYRNAQGIIIGDQLKKAGESVAFFDPDASGIRFVANSVITTEKMIKEHPKTVKKFVSALMKAWNEALNPDNSDKTVETIQKFDRDTSADVIRRQLDITRQFMKPSEKMVFGAIDIAAWKQTESIMLEQKLILAPVDIEKRLKTEYNRQ